MGVNRISRRRTDMRPIFQRRHYWAVAREIAAILKSFEDHPAKSNYERGYETGVREFANRFAHVFGRDNAKFSTAKFLEAAGVRPPDRRL
jgi:hypothetical protein